MPRPAILSPRKETWQPLYRRLGGGNHGNGKVETAIINEPSWSTTPFAFGGDDISSYEFKNF
jgi:hypothetical protein